MIIYLIRGNNFYCLLMMCILFFDYWFFIDFIIFYRFTINICIDLFYSLPLEIYIKIKALRSNIGMCMKKHKLVLTFRLKRFHSHKSFFLFIYKKPFIYCMTGSADVYAVIKWYDGKRLPSR